MGVCASTTRIRCRSSELDVFLRELPQEVVELWQKRWEERGWSFVDMFLEYDLSGISFTRRLIPGDIDRGWHYQLQRFIGPDGPYRILVEQHQVTEVVRRYKEQGWYPPPHGEITTFEHLHHTLRETLDLCSIWFLKRLCWQRGYTMISSLDTYLTAEEQRYVTRWFASLQ